MSSQKEEILELLDREITELLDADEMELVRYLENLYERIDTQIED